MIPDFPKKRPLKQRAPYDPFKDMSGVCRVVTSWSEIEEDDVEGGLKTLARFRKAFPEHGRIPKEELTWGYIWVEAPVLLDLGKTPEERVEKRIHGIHPTVAYCCAPGQEGTMTYSADLPSPPPFVWLHLFAQESDRDS